MRLGEHRGLLKRRWKTVLPTNSAEDPNKRTHKIGLVGSQFRNIRANSIVHAAPTSPASFLISLSISFPVSLQPGFVQIALFIAQHRTDLLA